MICHSMRQTDLVFDENENDEEVKDITHRQSTQQHLVFEDDEDVQDITPTKKPCNILVDEDDEVKAFNLVKKPCPRSLIRLLTLYCACMCTATTNTPKLIQTQQHNQTFKIQIQQIQT